MLAEGHLISTEVNDYDQRGVLSFLYWKSNNFSRLDVCYCVINISKISVFPYTINVARFSIKKFLHTIQNFSRVAKNELPNSSIIIFYGSGSQISGLHSTASFIHMCIYCSRQSG